jgi:cytochrome c oxidase assembly protein subunit 15
VVTGDHAPLADDARTREIVLMSLHQLSAEPSAALARRRTDPVRVWLFAVAALVFALVSVGGATRLTGSGLSITEWQPIMGVVPPLTEAAWQEALQKYRQIPQYQHVNRGMSLDAFKFIFWWEWTHRFLARLVGAAFLVPFLFFLATGRISRALVPKLAALFALGGLQGAMGWYMVRSGLVDRIDVSQYRLAAHLSLAFLIFAGLLWTAFSLGPPRRDAERVPLLHRRTAALLVGLVFLQIVAGAFVAGLKAGAGYNTWPLMDGRLVPDGLWAIAPWWVNLFENATTVQFNHRMLAYALLALAAGHAWSLLASARDSIIRGSALALAGAVAAQAALGIWTLLAQVPLSLGLVHQAGAVVVFGIALWHLHLVLAQRQG